MRGLATLTLLTAILVALPTLQATTPPPPTMMPMPIKEPCPYYREASDSFYGGCGEDIFSAPPRDVAIVVACRGYSWMDAKDTQVCRWGERIAGATITINGQSQTTDEQGVARFPSAAGITTVQGSKSGYETASASLDVALGKPVSLPMSPQKVTVQGQVNGEDGKPVPGINVGACCDGERWTSDATGGFIAQVIAGQTSFDLDGTGFQHLSAQRDVAPGATLTFVMKKSPVADVTIHGFARDQDGKPVPGARISAYTYVDGGGPILYFESPDGMASASTIAAPEKPQTDWYSLGGDSEARAMAGDDGSFTLRVIAGHVSLSASRVGYDGAYNDLDLQSGASIDITLTMEKHAEKSARIQGKIVDRATGEPLNLEAWRLGLQVNSDAMGQWYCIDVEGQPDWSDKPYFDDGMGISISRIAMPVEPTNETDGPHADDPLWGDDWYENEPCPLTLHDDGTFEGYVLPGYTRFAVYPDRGCDANDPQCAPGYYPWVTTIDLSPKATTLVTALLEPEQFPTGGVQGSIHDATSNEALSGVGIQFSRGGGDSGTVYASTDEFGRYTARLWPGYYLVRVDDYRHFSWEGTVIVGNDYAHLDVLAKDNPKWDDYGGYIDPWPGGPDYPADGGFPTPTQPGLPSRPTPVPTAQPDQPDTAVDGETAGHENPSSVPERPSLKSPAAGILFAAALLGVAAFARRRLA